MICLGLIRNSPLNFDGVPYIYYRCKNKTICISRNKIKIRNDLLVFKFMENISSIIKLYE